MTTPATDVLGRAMVGNPPPVAAGVMQALGIVAGVIQASGVGSFVDAGDHVRIDFPPGFAEQDLGPVDAGGPGLRLVFVAVAAALLEHAGATVVELEQLVREAALVAPLLSLDRGRFDA